MYDIIIIGAGPAGLTAALYARRAEKSVLLIEKAAFGGQITYSPKIENYPGCKALSGNELAEQMLDQVLSLGAEVESAAVTGIRDRSGKKGKTVLTEDGSFEGKAVILATGVKHRRLGTAGEEQFIGKGISYCAVCDGAFYKGKDVAVIGGGNSALQEAILLAGGCKSVTLVQNLPHFTGEESLLRALKNYPNVQYLTGSVVSEFLHEGEELKGLRLYTLMGETKDLMVDGVFVAVGLEPDNRPFEDTVRLDGGYVIAGEDCETSAPGIFAAGDCRKKSVRQITTATSDGSVAALAACRYIDRMEGNF